MSTLLNGLKVDETQFKRDLDRLVKGARAAAAKATSQREPERDDMPTGVGR